MRTRHIIISLTILTTCLIPFNGYGQTVGSDSLTSSTTIKTKRIVPKKIKYPHFYAGFTGNYGMMTIKPEKAGFDFTNSPLFGGGLYCEMRLTKWLGIETGANYWKTKGDIKQAASFNYTIEKLTDSEDDEYNSLISAKEVNESWKCNIIEIPFALKFQLPVGNWTFYLKPGASYNIASGASYEQNGYYSRDGYYPETKVTFIYLPSHGFYSNQRQVSKGTPAFTNFINPFIGFGIIFPAQSGNFFVEAKYYPSSLSMAKSGNGTLFEGPENLGVLNNTYKFESVTEESGKITLSGLSFSMGFRF